jgi:hypothetical protein
VQHARVLAREARVLFGADERLHREQRTRAERDREARSGTLDARERGVERGTEQPASAEGRREQPAVG